MKIISNGYKGILLLTVEEYESKSLSHMQKRIHIGVTNLESPPLSVSLTWVNPILL